MIDWDCAGSATSNRVLVTDRQCRAGACAVAQSSAPAHAQWRTSRSVAYLEPQ